MTMWTLMKIRVVNYTADNNLLCPKQSVKISAGISSVYSKKCAHFKTVTVRTLMYKEMTSFMCVGPKLSCSIHSQRLGLFHYFYLIIRFNLKAYSLFILNLAIFPKHFYVSSTISLKFCRSLNTPPSSWVCLLFDLCVYISVFNPRNVISADWTFIKFC